MPKITITLDDIRDDIPEYLKEFYEEGRQAKRDGVRLWKCPHKGITPLERAWQAGWTDEEFEMVHKDLNEVKMWENYRKAFKEETGEDK